ncbi:MAG TPA: SDR family oxidoreductase [Kofleriaceae bacterium]
MTDRVLITGAGGYLGQRLAERLLDTSDASVVLWLHGDTAAPPPPPRTLARFGTRVQVAAGELGEPDAFAGVDPSSLTHIIHAAAVTRFNVEPELADRVNLDGARQVFELASRCPELQHLVQVSTVYAAGLREGVIAEAPLDRAARFANHYERSKWEAEQLLLTEYSHLPATIARVATVIVDELGGAVGQRNAVHNTLRLLFHGLLSLVPGEATTPVYFVTGQIVVDALAALVLGSKRPRVVHVSYAADESATFGELVDVAFDVFATDAGFRSRRLLKPLLVDAESFELLVSGIDGFGGDAVRQALASVAPFARQLFSAKQVKNDELRALLPDYAAPPPAELVRRTVETLVETRWGKARA